MSKCQKKKLGMIPPELIFYPSLSGQIFYAKKWFYFSQHTTVPIRQRLSVKVFFFCFFFFWTAVLASRCYSHGKQETDEEFDARWVTYFNKPDIDAWELRKGMNTLIGYDLVPEPKILEAALRACRRLNDLASAIRILEAVKDKAGPHKEIYPYVIQELKPTLDELGISTPEELGIDKV
uniref:Cytochrome c oxidase subunit 5A, mitochondrial n=1 Tax=Oryzias latipes TaxID=8090 RepID=A0A3B3HR30_ORYLA